MKKNMIIKTCDLLKNGSRDVYKRQVVSDKYSQNKRDVRLAQLDRAFGYGPKGRGFESSNAR